MHLNFDVITSFYGLIIITINSVHKYNYYIVYFNFDFFLGEIYFNVNSNYYIKQHFINFRVYFKLNFELKFIILSLINYIQ
jgi:hypothetical protein